MGGSFDALFLTVTIIGSMALGATVFLAAPVALASVRAASRRHRWALALWGIFVLALMLRIWLPPASLFHDHNHGYRYLQVMFENGPHQYRLEYGIGGFNVFRFFLRVLPTEPQSVFGLNIAFGALTVFPVYGLARWLWRSRRAGLFAALAIACLPPHVRLSSTEDLYVLATLLEATTLAALLAWLRTRERRYLALTVAAVVLVVQIRETMNLVPLFCIAGFFALDSGWRQRLRDRDVWLATAAALLFALPHAILFARYSLSSLASQAPSFDGGWIAGTFVRMVSLESVYLDPRVTLPVAGLLAAAGIVIGFRRDRRALGFVLSMLLVFSWIGFLKSITSADLVMFHVHYGIFVAVLIGIGVDGLWGRFGGRRVAPVAIAALLVLPAGAYAFISERSNIQREFACVDAAVARIPAGCRLVTLTNGQDVGSEPIGVRFDYLRAFDHTNQLGITEFLRAGRLDGCHVYYQQRICYEPTADELLAYCGLDRERFTYPQITRCIRRYRRAHADTMQPLCAAMHERVPLEPIATCRFRSRPLDVDPMAPGRWLELGVYRITGRPTPGRIPPPRSGRDRDR